MPDARCLQVLIEHHHPADPEGDDLAGGAEDRRRVEGVEEALVQGSVVRSGIGPTERAERPERGGEPGVENVGVAGDFSERSVVRSFARSRKFIELSFDLNRTSCYFHIAMQKV